METYVRGLESLGQCENSHGSLLVPVILDKLPPQIRENLVRGHGSTNWHFSDLRQDIYNEVIILEASASTTGVYERTEPRMTAAFVTDTKMKQRFHRNNFIEKNDVTRSPVKTCFFCKGQHSAINCDIITDVEERYAIVKRDRLCFNCLGNHRVAECKSLLKCKKCHKRHHTTLCRMHITNRNRRTGNAGGNERNVNQNQAALLHSGTTQTRGHVLLKTAVAPVHGNTTRDYANILLDEGAQKSFITEELAHRLDLIVTGTETIQISGFGDTQRRVRHLGTTTIHLETLNGNILPVSVMIVPEIAVPLTTHASIVTNLQYLSGLRLAHPLSENEEFAIEFLIGSDYYWDIVGDQIVRGEGPTAVQSKLGYLLLGPLPEPRSSHTTMSMMNVMCSHKSEEINLQKFWEIETMGTESAEKDTHHAEETLELYQEKCVKFDKKGYVANLPWKEDHPELPTNCMIARKRTRNVVNRLSKDPKMLALYSGIIADQEKRGFIEKVKEEIRPRGKVHYIPHHPVKKDSSTTPIRIVYDCSCRQNGESPSVNDCLSDTPPVLNKLTDILIKFRFKKYAITTDIEKAFLHVGLAEEDRDVTRFFWLSDPADPQSELVIYRFKVVLFGATCSPFILSAVLLKHLRASSAEISQQFEKELYVDNVISSVDSEEEAVKYFHVTRELLSRASFNLRSWMSNCSGINQAAIKEGVLDTDEETKVLGIRWNANSDVIKLSQQNRSPDDPLPLTKREILKQSATTYDPLGLIGPVTVRSKLLMQKLWSEKYGWDEPLPESVQTTWRSIKQDIGQVLTETEIPRYYFNDCEEEGDVTLHVFVDASQKAYGACAYICKRNTSTLVIAKNRVAPLKEITLPKLELMAAVIGARIARDVIQTLKIERAVFWSDSQIVLHWLSSTKPLNRFTRNRVNEIKSVTEEFTWRYVRTIDNLADLQTRGLSAKQYQHNALWNHGPQWITKKDLWPEWSPENVMSLSTQVDEDDEKQDQCDRPIIGISKVMDLSRYNDLKKLIRVTKYVLLFIQKCRARCSKYIMTKVPDENQAIELWIKDAQNSDFNKERDFVKGCGKPVSLAKQLRLYEDESGILRCGGRIQNATLHESVKYPILLPKRHKFTDLIVMNSHEKLLHGGSEQTITHIRQSFWIPSIRQCVNHVLHRCIRCRSLQGKAYPAPDPPPLPKERVIGTEPFATTGVDFAGPLYVKDKQSRKKMYICLFTCACIRAIHLELVPDLSLESFILSFRRFTSSKATSKTVFSDNAATFVSASREIPTQLGLDIDWKFIPKAAPWYGGWWERLIGLTKSTLKKVLGKALVGEEELRTILCEIESVINDRPTYTYTSADIRDPDPLTPSHLLHGRRINDASIPRETAAAVGLDRQSANKLLSRKLRLLHDFQQRWKTEYLTRLREFHKVSGINSQQIKVGDVVHVQDNNPRVQWKLGRVSKLIIGNDGLIRAAELKNPSGLITNRPIVKLYPLEI